MDTALMEGVNRFARATGWLHPLATGYAAYGIVVFALLLAAGWWAARRSGDPRRMAAAVIALVAVPLAVALNQPIVYLVARPRPYTAHPGLLVLAQHTTDYSFPSDHATMAGATAAALWLVSRVIGAITSLAAVLIAGARVYIAAHYPGDVLAGLLLGAAVALTLYLLTRAVLTRLVVTAGRTRLRPLLAAR
jgi:membrane-associated phospholipid phosphatase